MNSLPSSQDDRLIDFEETAHLLGDISERSVRRLIASGELPPLSTNNLLDIFVGVDLGKSFHCAAAINSRGNVLLKPLKVLASAEGFAAFEGAPAPTRRQTALLIGLEASGHYWMSLWRFLLERDWQVEVFNPVLSSRAPARICGDAKTDADDALFIARTVRDGDFIPFQPGGKDTEQLKLLCRQRRFVSHELANAKRRLTGLIDLSFPEFSGHFEITTARRLRPY